MSKHWVKQEIKKNEVAEGLGAAVEWATANREMALGIAGGIIGVAILAGLYIHNTYTVQTTSWEKFAIAQSYAFQGRPDAAVSQMKELESSYGHSTAAGFGQLFIGDLFFRQGSYKEAAAEYQKLIDAQAPKTAMPFALSDLGIAQEAAGDCKSAIETDQHFLDTFQDNFLAPQVHASLARCLDAMGQKDKAKATYERMALLYPETYWAQWAQSRLKS